MRFHQHRTTEWHIACLNNNGNSNDGSLVPPMGRLNIRPIKLRYVRCEGLSETEWCHLFEASVSRRQLRAINARDLINSLHCRQGEMVNWDSVSVWVDGAAKKIRFKFVYSNF